MRQNAYELEKNIEKLHRGEATGFLTQNLCLEIKRKLKKTEYQEYIPYPSAEKTILYCDSLPIIRLFQIDCYESLKHSAILGSLFSLNISSESFGDIVFYQGKSFIYLLDSVSDLINQELTKIGRYPVKLVEVDVNMLIDFEREYQRLELIVSSLRIDTIVARLVNCNREKVQYLIKNKEILLNYEVVKKSLVLVQDGDIFSIRGYGKYRFRGIIGRTKKENYVIIIDKYT